LAHLATNLQLLAAAVWKQVFQTLKGRVVFPWEHKSLNFALG